MDLVEKYLGEGSTLSQGKFMSTMAKGLKDVSDVTSTVAMSLYHYIDPRITGSKVGGIYKTQKSSKIMDELWFRLVKNIVDSERLTDDAIKKLKTNFYSFKKLFMSSYEWNSYEKRWEYK